MNLTHERFRQVESWILRNGRPLEAARYAMHFQGEGPERFLELLRLYQNADGGFGHALEPDGWNPHSTPYCTLNALNLLSEAGVDNYAHPLYQGALAYLASGDSFEDGLWLFSVPSSNDSPHAPWWGYDISLNQTENLGLSSALAAFVLSACPADTPLYQTALAIARRAYERLMSGATPGVMGIDGFMALRPHWQALSIAENPNAVDGVLRALVNASIVRDPALWEQYVPRPSAAIHSPDSPFYAENRADLEKELDYLIATLPREDDVWPINWCWFQEQEHYPKAFAISESWWKAWKAIDKLRLLRAFGRID